jgi:uncharacterized protein (TIGR02001 family)
MKTCFYAAVCALAAGPAVSQEAQPETTMTYNVAVTTDYRYRGISQSRLQPAIQGGADYTNNRNGLYVGTWASSINWTRDAGGDGDAEIDIYGGKRGELGGGVKYDAGLLGYLYPGNNLARLPNYVNANTLEIYGQLGYGPAYAKYSVALTNLFGYPDSRRSSYLDLGANVDLGYYGLTGIVHVGRQTVRSSDVADYTDWRVGVSRDFGVATLTLSYIGTNANEAAYSSSRNGKFLGRKALQLMMSRTF